jgi:hypothetical protein
MPGFVTSTDFLANAAFLLLAVSYWLTNIYWLRATAVAGLLLQLIAVRLSGSATTAEWVWPLVLIAINCAHLFAITRDRLSLKLPEKDAPLLRDALSGLDDSQISRLLKAAEWRDFQPGEKLTRQDAPVDHLYFLCSGRANVEVNGSFVTYLEKGSFVGEIAYLTGNPATATVVIEEPSRMLAFSKIKMAKVTASDSQINGIIYQLLGRDLAMKMRRTNTRKVLIADDLTTRV